MCNAGLFLEAALASQFEVTGVEISRIAAKHCTDKDLNIINASFHDSISDLPEQIDVIHMRNILEHVNDPGAFIASAYELLADNSLLVIAVPKDDSPRSERFESASRV